MKPAKRVIVGLDVKGGSLVKGVHMEGFRVLGEPSDFASLYYDQGVDEFFLSDAVASLYRRNTISEIVTETARNVFVPITVAGGIRKPSDVELLLKAGADKVAINTAIVHDPKLIDDLVKIFGCSTIVANIQVSRVDGTYIVFTDNGREYTGLTAEQWAKEVELRGVGEIILTSIDREGTGLGLDLEIAERICASSRIPVVIRGGVGDVQHVVDGLEIHGVSGVCISSFFHYYLINSQAMVQPASVKKLEGNTEFLSVGNRVWHGQTASVSHAKEILKSHGIQVRV
ncbi:imidazole glycerol phosphate synthase cyclase subunit [Litoricolaceae bacterium]|nr:imidazole glycerol phosphate synthase cyclase subunit [Litorivicinaceae bacterium]